MRPYKFLIVAVVQEVDDDGTVIAELRYDRQGHPLEVFGVDGLRVFADSFEQQLADARSPSSVGHNGS